MELKTIELDACVIGPVQDMSDYQDLVDSVREIGVLNPIIVRRVKEDKFEVIDGNKRVLAARVRGLRTIDAKIVVISDADLELMKFTTPSVKCQPTSPEQQASLLRRILKTNPTMTVQQLAVKIGRSVAWIDRILEKSGTVIPIV